MEAFDTISWVRSVLASTPHRWNDLITSLPTELLYAQPKPGEWSVLECLQHMIDTEDLYLSRIQAFMTGAESFPAFHPDREGTKVENASPLDLAAEFSRRRHNGLSAIDQLNPVDLLRKSKHAELGPVTLREMLSTWAAHDLNHTVQAERALMQPFLHNCGPWIVYYEDHKVE